jgi:hypothetical protein
MSTALDNFAELLSVTEAWQTLCDATSGTDEENAAAALLHVVQHGLERDPTEDDLPLAVIDQPRIRVASIGESDGVDDGGTVAGFWFLALPDSGTSSEKRAVIGEALDGLVRDIMETSRANVGTLMSVDELEATVVTWGGPTAERRDDYVEIEFTAQWGI